MSSKNSKAVIAGFAIFSMIFGSGNIVFPLILGKNHSHCWHWAALGWIATTAIIPMIGYYGSMLYNADTKKYLSPIGKHAISILMLLIMLLIGPFGVIARGVNVSFGGVHVVYPYMSEYLFNFVFCLVTLLLAWHPGKIVQLMGTVFTPLKFGGAFSVIIGSLLLCKTDVINTGTESLTAFSESFKTGYQTLDLLASFIMSTTIYQYARNSLPESQRDEKKAILKFCAIACIVGGIILAIVYAGLTLVGAKYASLLQATPDSELFAKIAGIAMGNAASWFIAIVIAACCLATNILLTSVFTDYIHKDILKEKFNRNAILLIVGITTYVVSLLGFSEICSIMAIVLEKIYPAIIILVIARITYYYAKRSN